MADEETIREIVASLRTLAAEVKSYADALSALAPVSRPRVFAEELEQLAKKLEPGED